MNWVLMYTAHYHHQMKTILIKHCSQSKIIFDGPATLKSKELARFVTLYTAEVISTDVWVLGNRQAFLSKTSVNKVEFFEGA